LNDLVFVVTVIFLFVRWAVLVRTDRAITASAIVVVDGVSISFTNSTYKSAYHSSVSINIKKYTFHDMS
jgi:hypothetical protein